MKNYTSPSLFSTPVTMVVCCFFLLLLLGCDSRYAPQTVPDNVAPVVHVTLRGQNVNLRHKIQGMEVDPPFVEETATLIPGQVYTATVVAADTVGLYNLRVGVLTEYFELTDLAASPGTITPSIAGRYSVVDVVMPDAPAKTGTVLTFKIRPRVMERGVLAPFLGLNIIATDFGDPTHSSNVTGATVPFAYFVP